MPAIERWRPSEPLQGHDLLFWTGYQRLSGDRNLGAMGGRGAVPFVAMRQFLEEYRVTDSTDREMFFEVMDHLSSIEAEEATGESRPQADPKLLGRMMGMKPETAHG